MSFVRAHRWQIAALVVTAALIAVGKHDYRTASAGELAWILAPTARLVSAVSGAHFTYEAGVGWVDRDVTFIIAPACAGVNFAMAALLALVLGWLSGMRTLRATLARLGAAAALAYVATLVVNTLRIAIAIALHQGTIDLGELDRGEVHRVEGILVYLAGLCALYALARALASRDRRALAGWIAVPIAAYLVITLGLPLANGAAGRTGYWHHAAWVVAGCAAMVAVAAVVRELATRTRAAAGRARAAASCRRDSSLARR